MKAHKSKRKEENKPCKKKKKEWIENIMEEIEIENKRNNNRPMYI